MPKVKSKPEGQTNGDLMIQFIDTVDKKGKTWEYETTQNHFFIQNEGELDIEVKVADETRTLRPTEQFGRKMDFTSFTAKAVTDEDEKTAGYSVYATEFGYPGKDKVEDIETAKPATNEPTDPEDEKTEKKTNKSSK